MAKISKEQAEVEINSWLDYKKVSKSKREENKAYIETLVDAMMDGILSMDGEQDKISSKEDYMSFTHFLKFPTEGETPLISLRYKARLKVMTVQSVLRGLKGDDSQAFIIAYACALTSQPKALIQALDTEDYKITQAIAVFFV